MKLKWIALLLALLLLSGCARQMAPAPMFDPDTVQEATASGNHSQSLVCQETFSNANGTTQFRVNLDTEIDQVSLPLVEAKPLHLTAEDAKAVIDALLPGAKCYERHPAYLTPENEWTKDALEENLARWRSYDLEDLAGFYGGVENLPVAMSENGDDIPFTEYWQKSLQYFETLLESAPEEDGRTPSLWQMFKETEYFVDPEEAKRMDLSQDRDCIQASVEFGEDHYYYVVASGIQNGVPSSLISLSYSTRSSPAEIDWQIFLAQNDALPAVTQEALDRAQEIAQSYVDSFPIGSWKLEKARPSDHDGTIYVEGCLVDDALPETEDAASFTAPRMSIRIHPDGRLLNFWVGGSLTEITTHATQTAELSMEVLLETALNHLRGGNTMAYGISEDALITFQIEAGEDVTCQADVTQAIHSFVPMDTPDCGVAYVPCLILKGEVSYVGKKTGMPMEASGLLPDGEVRFVIVNGIDGSIVPING